MIIAKKKKVCEIWEKPPEEPDSAWGDQPLCQGTHYSKHMANII